MNKYFTQYFSRFLLLIVIAFSSGCGQSTTIDSPTLAPKLSQTLTPNPTNTPEPIHPEGIIFYSGFNILYSIDLEGQRSKVVLKPPHGSSYLIRNNSIYITLFSEKSKHNEVFRTNLDGTEQRQLTTDSVIQIFNIDQTNHYLVYNNQEVSLIVLDLLNLTSQVIAERNKNAKGDEWIFAKSWSPDGKQLIYERVLNPAADDICTLFVYNITTGTSVQLPPNADGACGANWSPNGKSILFTTYKDQEFEVGILNLENGDIDYVPVGAFSYYSGSWSRDRKQLLMALTDEQDQTYLYTFNWEDNSINLVLKIGHPQHPSYFAWSPDGNMVLYEQEELSYKHSLYLLDLKNKKLTNLYTLRGLDMRYDFWWRYSPTWSSDGRYFTYFTMSSSETDLQQDFILNIRDVHADGSLQIRVPGQDYAGIVSWTDTTK